MYSACTIQIHYYTFNWPTESWVELQVFCEFLFASHFLSFINTSDTDLASYPGFFSCVERGNEHGYKANAVFFFTDDRFEHFYEDCNGFLFMRSPTVYRPLMCWLHWALCSSAGSHIWCITRCVSGSEASREDVQKFSRSLSFPLQWLHRHNCFQTDKISKSVSVCVCACVCACVRVCVRACVCVCVSSKPLSLAPWRRKYKV